MGPYEIFSPLGAGGMGEVYRARDTKLNRDVALKVLPEAVAHDADRMARFQREAQVLASLNQPNIASIYGLEESGGVRALVMELVEGLTLAERIGVRAGLVPAQGRPRGTALPLDESLHIAKQIAEALEGAHEKGIIHRDLKPANVKITPEGAVKVLDFGLAKAANESTSSSDPSSSPTLTAQATGTGMIMGTAAYMAPEQARGQAVDKRADIWAFGVVLFEMLTGRQAFEGETTSDVLASVLKFEPDWTSLPASTPPSIVRLLHRCLTKDRKQRLQALGEARIAIEETLSGSDTALPAAAEPQPPEARRASSRRALIWLALAALMMIAGVAVGWWAKARRLPPNLNWSAQILGGPSFAMGPRISPDGHTLAFQAMVNGLTQVAVMDAESGDWTVLTKDRSRGYVTEVNWSPDGSEIFFDRDFAVPQGIYSVSRFGGNEHLVLKDAIGPEVLPDGSLLVSRLNADREFQLYHFWPDNGRLEALAALPYSSDLCPAVRVFRDGKDAVFFGRAAAQNSAEPSQHLYVLNLASGKPRRLDASLELAAPLDFPIYPIGIASDDDAVLVNQMAGNLNRIIAIPRSGAGRVQTLLTLTLPPLLIDVGRDGELYLDQMERPYEVLRFAATGGTPEPLAGSENSLIDGRVPFQLPDGRDVFGTMIAGRRKLLAASAGGELSSLVQTKEDASFPACMVGKDAVAFLLGPPGHEVVALASVADGQIVRRYSEIPAGGIVDLAASADGSTLYYGAAGDIWAVPVSGGKPRRIAAGLSVAADPNGKDLMVVFRDREGIRLVRVPASGESGTQFPIQTELRVSPIVLSPNAVGRDGRVLVTLAPPDSWFYLAGVFNPKSGEMKRIPLNFAGDNLSPGWLPDGRILAGGMPTKVSLWRFRPTTRSSP